MASTFAFAYDYVAPGGALPSGQERTYSYGPYPWANAAVAVSAHPSAPEPLHLSAILEVTRVRFKDPGESRYLLVSVRNHGPSSINFQLVIGGVRP